MTAIATILVIIFSIAVIGALFKRRSFGHPGAITQRVVFDKKLFKKKENANTKAS